MKINRPEIANLIHRIYKREQVHSKIDQVDKTAFLQEDRLEISTSSEMLKKEFDRLAAPDAFRSAKIERLARQLEDGEYQVDSRKLAAAMLKYMEMDGDKDG